MFCDRTAKLLRQHEMSQMQGIGIRKSSSHEKRPWMKGYESRSNRSMTTHWNRIAILLCVDQMSQMQAIRMRRGNPGTTVPITAIGNRKLIERPWSSLNNDNSSIN
jgi:hypothetical protein